ncbi:hypothetical protein L914_16250, partial [Phytophthora nicotianae]
EDDALHPSTQTTTQLKPAYLSTGAATSNFTAYSANDVPEILYYALVLILDMLHLTAYLHC